VIRSDCGEVWLKIKAGEWAQSLIDKGYEFRYAFFRDMDKYYLLLKSLEGFLQENQVEK